MSICLGAIQWKFLKIGIKIPSITQIKQVFVYTRWLKKTDLKFS